MVISKMQTCVRDKTTLKKFWPKAVFKKKLQEIGVFGV
jgi:hypothetical protein